ncbi:hypothetical protein CEP51_010310 [Fusarium floridanum]|uniref:Uncharacterized protein n=1 Tax=Fusarium floridanum TaxID=1325733 RepID=A0A428REV5_9HYPO|nr:hypothetical protein CEP51_010310 [Fusarium floridanum]
MAATGLRNAVEAAPPEIINVLDDESEFAKLIEEFQPGNASEMMVNLEDAIENSTQDEGYPHSQTADSFNAPWEAPAPRQHADEPNVN